MARQKITIVIDSRIVDCEGGKYELVDVGGYEGLRHFFEDIHIKVERIDIEELKGEE